MKYYRLPQEHLLKLNIDDVRIVTLICTDDALRELILGFLKNEGLIASPAELAGFELASDHSYASVRLRNTTKLAGEVRASGLGGGQLTAEAVLPPKPLARRFSEEYIRSCAASMDALSVKYAETGGVHCSAIFDGEAMLSLFEDVGRHNTLDKLCGDCLLHGIDAEDTLLVTTGRISSDMVRKAGLLGASAIASYSTATARARDMAVDAGMTLIGYLRRQPLNMYCGTERIL